MSRILVFLDNDRGSLSPFPDPEAPHSGPFSGRDTGRTRLGSGDHWSRTAKRSLESVGLPGYVVSHPILSDYAPEAYGEALAQLVNKHRAPRC